MGSHNATKGRRIMSQIRLAQPCRFPERFTAFRHQEHMNKKQKILTAVALGCSVQSSPCITLLGQRRFVVCAFLPATILGWSHLSSKSVRGSSHAVVRTSRILHRAILYPCAKRD